MTALVFGDALIDLVSDQSGAVHSYPGGSPLNVAVGLGRLDRPVQLGAHVGRDAHGEQITQHLAQSKAKLLPGSETAHHTSTALAKLDQQGKASYVFDFAWQAPPLPADLNPTVIHTGSLAATVEPGGSQMLALFQANQAKTTLTYDPNARPAAMGPAAAIRPRIEAMVSLAHVVKASDEDLSYLYPDQDPMISGQQWAMAGPALVVVTLGANGAQAITTGGLRLAQAAQKTKVADTVGAGDAFMAGLIDALWRLNLLGPGKTEALRGIDQTQLAQVLAHATRLAAITVSRPGANPPWSEEL